MRLLLLVLLLVPLAGCLGDATPSEGGEPQETRGAGRSLGGEPVEETDDGEPLELRLFNLTATERLYLTAAETANISINANGDRCRAFGDDNQAWQNEQLNVTLTWDASGQASEAVSLRITMHGHDSSIEGVSPLTTTLPATDVETGGLQFYVAPADGAFVEQSFELVVEGTYYATQELDGSSCY